MKGENSKNLLEKLMDQFPLDPKDRFRVINMQVYIFLVILTLLIIKPTASSLFLSRFGVEALPVAFILTAVLAAIFSTGYAWLLRYYNLRRLIDVTLIGCVFSLLIFGLLLSLDLFRDILLYVFYLWVLIFALVTTSQFWMLANLSFTSREAKQLFGVIGAGAIAGGIFGGYLASFLSRYLESENLLFVAAVTLSPCIFILNNIWSDKVSNLYQDSQRMSRDAEVQTHRHPVFLIFESRHLFYTASIVGVSVVVAKLVDYQFSAIAAQAYPDTEDLTAFFGFWFSTFNVISLGLQLFLTRRIMESLGVSRALYLLPVLIFFVALGMTFFPEVLMIAIGLKMVDGSLKQSVNKAAMELLILPVPIRIKNSAKTFIDVFVDSFATGIAGILLIFLIRGMELPSEVISGMVVVLSLLWIVLIVKIRKQYLRAFRTKIEEIPDLKFDLDHQKVAPVFLPYKRIKGQFEKIIRTGSDKEIIKILRYVRSIRKKTLFDKTTDLLNHPSAKVRAAAIENVKLYQNQDAVEEMEELLMDRSIDVQAQALDYLLKHDDEHRMEVIDDHLENHHYKLRGVALIHLAKLALKNPELKTAYNLENRLYDWYYKIKKVSREEDKRYRLLTFLKAVGQGKLVDYYGYISYHFKSIIPEVKRQAILAAGHTRELAFINPLIDELEHSVYQNAARKALARYGLDAFPVYLVVLKNPETDKNILRAIPVIIKKVKHQRTVDLLTELLAHTDFKVRQEALRSLNRLRISAPKLTYNYLEYSNQIMDEIDLYRDLLSVVYFQRQQVSLSETHQERVELREAREQLIKSIKRRLDFQLERIFLLLGLQYDPKEMWTAYRGVRSNRTELRNSALEFLDNLLTIDLKKIIIPILETATFEQITTDAIQKLDLYLPDEKEAFEKIRVLKDKKINRLIATLEAG